MAQDNSERTIRRKLAGSDHMVEAVFDFPVMVLRDDGEWVTRNSWSLRGAEGNWDPSSHRGERGAGRAVWLLGGCARASVRGGRLLRRGRRAVR